MFSSIKKMISEVSKVASMYIFWTGIHYLSSYLYIWYCVPPTLVGFLLSPLAAVMPYCNALRHSITIGASTMSTGWLVFGTWICTKLIGVGWMTK